MTLKIKLNVASVLDDETILKVICEILDLDYEEIQSKLPDEPKTNLNKASEDLANVIIDGGANE